MNLDRREISGAITNGLYTIVLLLTTLGSIGLAIFLFIFLPYRAFVYGLEIGVVVRCVSALTFGYILSEITSNNRAEF